MKFIVRNNVPILDEHVLRDEEGEEVIRFTRKRLEHIAATNNARIARTGDLIPLVIGHTRDGEAEESQPEIVGYAKDLKVLPFKKTRRKAIHAKFYFFKDKVAKVKNFPRRSIELWLGDGKIDPISLLGATTPDRDLGLLQLEKAGAVLQFASGGRRKYKRLLDADTKPKEESSTMDEKALVGAVMEALKQSSVWKWCEAKIQEEEAQGDDGLPPEGGDLEDAGMEEEELPDELAGEPGDEGPEEEEDLPLEEEEEDEEPEGEQPVRFNAGSPACPSGSNTFVPSYGAHNRNPSNMNKKPVAKSNHNVDKKGKAPQAARSGPQQMSRPANGQLVRFQKALRFQAAQNQELRLKFQRSERERDLMELAGLGYEFDPVEELDYVTHLPEDHYSFHLNRIKKRYQKSPVGPAAFDLSMARNPQPGPQGRTKADVARITAYATKKGISYEDALEECERE